MVEDRTKTIERKTGEEMEELRRRISGLPEITIESITTIEPE
jgi:hypothetical protein